MKCILILVIKNYRWIWIAVDRNSREYVDMVVGDRSRKTGLLLWNKLKEQATGLVATDYWKAYNDMISKEILLQSKAETYTVESYNSLIRHFLARFRRKTKCYSKSQEMMELSLKLLMAKRNKLISMQCY